jgi:hypothetical protein
MDDLIERLVELESIVQYLSPPAPGESEFCHSPGTIPILISAPHGAAHRRNGRSKEEDEYTVGLARLLAERTGAHALYVWRCSETDPNFDTQAPYKQALKEIVLVSQIKFVLDLHGCAPDRSFGIGLGSIHGRSCPQQLPAILKVLEAYSYSPHAKGLLRLDIDDTFPGGGGRLRETITRYVSTVLGVPALQVELNAYLRVVRRLPSATEHEPFEGKTKEILRAIHALEDVIKAVLSTFERLSRFR